MNDFYSIALENTEPINEYQLKNIGTRRIMATLGKPRRGDWGERMGYEYQRFYTDTKPEDYDDLFATKITNVKPPYELNNLLEFHCEQYLKIKNGTKDKFVKHVKYVVLPIIKQRIKSEVYAELVEEWINQNNMNSINENRGTVTLNMKNISAPTQVQVNSNSSTQKQVNSFAEKDIKQLFEALEKDLINLEKDLKEELQAEMVNALKYLNKGKNINSRLETIGSLIREVGLSVFSNLIASPIFEIIRPYLGL